MRALLQGLCTDFDLIKLVAGLTRFVASPMRFPVDGPTLAGVEGGGERGAGRTGILCVGAEVEGLCGLFEGLCSVVEGLCRLIEGLCSVAFGASSLVAVE